MSRSISVMSLILLLLSASFASARQETEFERYSRKLAQGKHFDFSEALGWYSGRCWRTYSDTPLNGLLILEARDTRGPDLAPVRKFSFYQWPDQKEDFFDRHSALHVEEDHPRTKRERMLEYWAETIKADLDADWNEISRMTEEKVGFSDNYSHLKLMTLRRDSDDKYFVLKRGEDLACYFFKKIDEQGHLEAKKRKST
jgi:hypothetical protein